MVHTLIHAYTHTTREDGAHTHTRIHAYTHTLIHSYTFATREDGARSERSSVRYPAASYSISVAASGECMDVCVEQGIGGGIAALCF